MNRYSEQLTALMPNSSLRTYMTKDAIRTSKRFKMEKIVAEWMNLFEELMSERSID